MHCTSNPIVLKVPSGGAWEVKLTKFDDDDHLWLGEGWPEFARHHSIKCGYTLYFRNEGQSRFHVVIVNENGSEIDYPVNDSKHFDKIDPDFDELPLPEIGEENQDLHCDDSIFNSQSPPFPSPKKKALGGLRLVLNGVMD
ncbi:hypothetical protein CsatA_014132 [Cannabis sativa]